MGEYSGTAALYLAEQSQHLRAPERIFFHLVESRDEEFPFAFLATYATRGENDRITHVPLQYALTEYGADRAKLLELLSCLNRAAEAVPLIGEFMSAGELFHPLRLTAAEAYVLLKRTEELEGAGILCRVPNWWRKWSVAGYVLHGGTKVSRRSEIVEAFQGRNMSPFWSSPSRLAVPG